MQYGVNGAENWTKDKPLAVSFSCLLLTCLRAANWCVLSAPWTQRQRACPSYSSARARGQGGIGTERQGLAGATKHTTSKLEKTPASCQGYEVPTLGSHWRSIRPSYTNRIICPNSPLHPLPFHYFSYFSKPADPSQSRSNRIR